MNPLAIASSLEGLYSVSIIGNVKNAGKTVTLNYLVSQLVDVPLGITSIGLDGEKVDALTYSSKPSIMLPKNTVVATASQTLKSVNMDCEILKNTGIFNPLGEILFIRLMDSSEVIIAGPERASDLKKIIGQFKGFGCSKVLVDGAMDRKISAAPMVTDGTIYVAGASYSRDITRMIKDTVYKINLLSLQSIGDHLQKQVKEALKSSVIALIEEGKIIKLPYKSSILVKDISQYIVKDKETIVVIGGALLDNFAKQVNQLLSKGYKISLIVQDGTKIFLSPEIYNDFLYLGGTIEVIRACNVVALAVNPISIEGYEFSSEKLVESFRNFVNMPVFDPLM